VKEFHVMTQYSRVDMSSKFVAISISLMEINHISMYNAVYINIMVVVHTDTSVHI